MVISWEILSVYFINLIRGGLMQSVYKITNKLNNRYYIGSSSNVEQRIKAHYKNSRYKNIQPNNELYQDIRKYGEENFIVEILFENENIVEASRYESDIIKENIKDPLIYNKSIGASGRKVLRDSDIFFIRDLYQKKELYIADAYNKYYKDIISFRAFKKAWHGDSFKNIHYDVYTIENKKFHFSKGQSRPEEKNGRAIYSKQNVIDIRTRQKNGEDKQSVYQDYKYLNSKAGFDYIWNGKNWKSIIV